MKQIHHITARRIDGDVYDLEASHSVLCDRGSWNYVCRLAQSYGARKVTVLNSHSGPDELARIEYRISPACPLSDMPRPSVVTTPVVDYAER